MDLSLTRRGDYVIRAAVVLARSSGRPGLVRVEDVSRAMRIPESYAPQILGLLVRAGLAVAKPGRGGGYRLARPPEDITLLEVVETGDGRLAAKRCPLRGVPCELGGVCALHASWNAALDAIRASLRRTTLAQVAGGASALPLRPPA